MQVAATSSSLAEIFALAAPMEEDPCNKYPDCHSCITADESQHALKCGWCMGGKLNYFGVGETQFQCGGYKEGTPAKFTCEPLFQTTDCAGFGCNWTNPKQPKSPGERACACS